MSIAKRAATPEMFVARVIARMQPRLTRAERDVIAAGFARAMAPDIIGDLLHVCRKHKVRPTLPMLDLIEQTTKAGASAPASTRRGDSRANPTTSGDAHER